MLVITCQPAGTDVGVNVASVKNFPVVPVSKSSLKGCCVAQRVGVTVLVLVDVGDGVTIGVRVRVTVVVVFGVLVRVLVGGVPVAVEVGAHTGSAVLPVALIIQLPPKPGCSASSTPITKFAPRLYMSGAVVAFPMNHDLACEGGVLSCAAGLIFGKEQQGSAHASSNPIYRSPPPVGLSMVKLTGYDWKMSVLEITTIC